MADALHYLDIWMAEGRHYRIACSTRASTISTADRERYPVLIQRTQELGSNLLSSIVSLPVLRLHPVGISALEPLPLFGVDFSFPGYLIVGAGRLCVAGMVFAHFLGHKLIPLNFMQQRREADFRFAIGRVTDHAEPVGADAWQPVERGELKVRFAALVRNWLRWSSGVTGSTVRVRLLPHLDRCCRRGW